MDAAAAGLARRALPARPRPGAGHALMANLITLGRIALLFATVGLIYLRQPWSAFVAAFLTVVVFASDALDGYVARKLGRADEAGAVFDIAGDRVVENVYWVVCAHINLVPVW